MAKKKTTTKKSAPTFEQSLELLRTILSDLESGNLSLSESLEKYEQGVGHLKRCHSTLETAREKIELLVRVDGDGIPVKKSFDGAATFTEASDEEELSDEDLDELEDELNDDSLF